MLRSVEKIIAKWREYREKHLEEAKDILKARYHTFRILLANNETALDLLKKVDQSLRSPSPSMDSINSETEELLEVIYELVDGINRLTSNSYRSLYSRYGAISREIRKIISSSSAMPGKIASCVALDDISPDLKAITGGKAANLAFLKRSGFPVPDGFSVVTHACSAILALNGLDSYIRRRLKRLESIENPWEEIGNESLEIRRMILEQPIPIEVEKDLISSYERLTDNGKERVSVRSSAISEDKAEHSFAGQFRSILNVTSFSGFKSALLDVLASSFSQRAISYRLNLGLPLDESDMAVLCQLMTPSKISGVLFTVNPSEPDNGRMLISSVPGLGISAVGGSIAADLFMPFREREIKESDTDWSVIQEKKVMTVCEESGGIRDAAVPENEALSYVLSKDEVETLASYGRMIENITGRPQDIEWAMNSSREFYILQSRDIALTQKSRKVVEASKGVELVRGVCASPGRCMGRIRIINSAREIGELKDDGQTPYILVLPQSLVDAAAWLDRFEGVIVDLGNPADHLSCVAREYSRPMLTGAGTAADLLVEDEWVILDADECAVFRAPENLYSDSKMIKRRPLSEKRTYHVSEELSRLRLMIEPLNLTDAYGPTFSIQETRSLHDIIRFVHEMAVLAMFGAGDSFLERAGNQVRIIDEGLPFHFLIIDLGGGISQDSRKRRVKIGDVISPPFRSLWEGMSTPGLRWNAPPPGAGFSGLMGRSLLDGRSARPVGSCNYAMITRDYINLNARVDYHFTMIDAVCGKNPRGNHIRFRFKGGGTTALQRERRARFVAIALRSYGFSIQQHEDLVTAIINDMKQDEVEKRLVMLGKFLGFSRLLDAAMTDDSMPEKVAKAFLEGDYGLKSLADAES